MLPPLLVVILVIIIVSTVVGAVAKLINNLNEVQNANAARPRPGAAGAARQPSSDIDRFLAEIDRLRRKNAEAQATPPPPPPAAEKKPEPPRRRLATDPAEPLKEDRGFAPPPAPPPAPTELPVAQVVPPPPPGPDTSPRPRPAAQPRLKTKTQFAKNLSALLTTGQGLAITIVLQEILGPPKCKRRPGAGPGLGPGRI